MQCALLQQASVSTVVGCGTGAGERALIGALHERHFLHSVLPALINREL